MRTQSVYSGQIEGRKGFRENREGKDRKHERIYKKVRRLPRQSSKRLGVQ
jgi:hypothetical protein